jgi:hypothetical protein
MDAAIEKLEVKPGDILLLKLPVEAIRSYEDLGEWKRLLDEIASTHSNTVYILPEYAELQSWDEEELAKIGLQRIPGVRKIG